MPELRLSSRLRAHVILPSSFRYMLLRAADKFYDAEGYYPGGLVGLWVSTW